MACPHELPRVLEGEVGSTGKTMRSPEGYLFGWGKTVPTDADTGWAPGALFIHTDGDAYNTVLYCNIGDADSCDFNVVTVAQ